MSEKKKIGIIVAIAIILLSISVAIMLIKKDKQPKVLTPEQKAEKVEEKTSSWVADSFTNGVVKKSDELIEELETEGLLTADEKQELIENGKAQVGNQTIEIKNINLEEYIDIEEEDGIIKLKSRNTDELKKYGITEAKVRIVYPDLKTVKDVNLFDEDLGIEYPVNMNELYTFKIAPVNGQSAEEIKDITIMIKDNN